MNDQPGIRPPFALYELHARPSIMNSPAEACVNLYITDATTGGHVGRIDVLPPEQAREYARMILNAADAAEGKKDTTSRVEWGGITY